MKQSMCLRSSVLARILSRDKKTPKPVQHSRIRKKGQRNIKPCVTNWWTQRLSKNFIDSSFVWISVCISNVDNRLCCCARVLVILIALRCSKQCMFQFESIVLLFFVVVVVLYFVCLSGATTLRSDLMKSEKHWNIKLQPHWQVFYAQAKVITKSNWITSRHKKGNTSNYNRQNKRDCVCSFVFRSIW